MAANASGFQAAPRPSSSSHFVLRARVIDQEPVIWFYTMSGFVKKAKKKAGLFVDKLRPGSRQPSPTPPDPIPIPPAPSNDRHTYADPQNPPNAGATAGSVVYELLAAARDGSDLCLPLKAALTGVVKIWDVCEVCIFSFPQKKMLKPQLAYN